MRLFIKYFLSFISFVIDAYVDRLGIAVSWLTTVLMVLICIDVVLRYLFSITETWVVELEWHLFAIIFLVGASYTLLHDKHVRVDVFYEKYSRRTKDLVNTFGVLLFLTPWCIIIVVKGYDYTMNSWWFKEGSSQPNGLPARYLIKAFIPIGFLLLLIQGLSQLIKSTVRRK